MSFKGQLGQTVTIAGTEFQPSGISIPKTVIQAESDNGKNQAATLALFAMPIPGSAFCPPAFALVEWGSGGATSAAFVDVVNGCSFTIVCAWIRVSMIREITAAGTGRYGAVLASDLSATRIRPQRTIRPTVPIAPAGTATILVPPYGINFEVERDPMFSMDIFPQDLLAQNVFRRQPAISVPSGVIPIANNVTQILINNTGGGNITACSVVFGLGL